MSDDPARILCMYVHYMHNVWVGPGRRLQVLKFIIEL
eukprot:COSAG01_NODE_69126_length_262_cov_0.638037_1_plen_36_part_10